MEDVEQKEGIDEVKTVEVVIEMVQKAEPPEISPQGCEEVVEAEPHETASDYDSELEDEDGSDTEGSVGLEREEGDGQESAPAKKIDDDEDKKNPQYIPKRGTFYEHDDRTADDIEGGEAEEEKEKAEKEGKKKIWTDKKEKWSHDKFNDNDQSPKSRAELIAIYGYDIRNEEGPPRARRRRRYGRGPNKYTRNWEDEDAYNKPPAAVVKKAANPRKPRPSNQTNIIEQHPQQQQGEGVEEHTSDRQSSESQNDRTSEQSNQTNTYVRRELAPPPRPNPAHSEQQRQYQNNNKNQTRAGSGRVVKPNREIQDSDYRGFTKPRQFPPKRDKEREIKTQNFTNKRTQSPEGLEKEMGKLSVQDQQGYSKAKHGNNIPPRMQAEQKGSKRYSSIRQRTLPEQQPPQQPPPFNQQHNYYVNAEYTQAQTQQGAAPRPLLPPPPLPRLPQPVPVTTTPIPPQFAPAFAQAPPPFLQAPPQPFIPQPNPPIINFVQPQPAYQQPYQGYQQQFNTVSQPTDIFQPPGGITYYSAQDQVGQRAAPQKRPKAAIPIVPPPPELRGRGRSQHEANFGPNAGELELVKAETGGNFEDAVSVQ